MLQNILRLTEQQMFNIVVMPSLLGEKELRLQECVSEIQTVRFQSHSKLRECNEISAFKIISSGFDQRFEK